MTANTPRPQRLVRVSGQVPLTILSGLERHVVADVAAGLLLRESRLALVWADPFTAELGFIQTRVTDSDGRCTERSVELAHGCLSCAMRDGVIEAVRGLAGTGRYDTILVHLHPGIETNAAVGVLEAGLVGTATIDTVVTVLNDRWLDQLASDATTQECGIAVAPDDERTAATVLAAGIDAATVIVTLRDPADVNADEHAALSVLAPDAIRIYPITALDLDPALVLQTGAYRSFKRGRFSGRGLLDPGLTVPVHNGNLQLIRWSSQRPLHPARLHEALDELADGVIRSTGYLWLATRPEMIVGWDSAGDCLQLGPDGLWRTELCDDPTVEPTTLLAFLGEGLDEEHIYRVLSACRLTDAELDAGVQQWRTLEDPFPDWSDAFDTDAQQGAA